VVVMSQGKIEQVGSADDIYDRPATPFVFDFIGDSSGLPVVVDDGKVRLGDRIIAIDARGEPNGPATLFFRPNHIRVAGRGEQNGSIVGVVSGSRRIGDARRLEVEIESQHRIEIDVPAEAELPNRSQVAVSPQRWRLYPR